MFLQVMSGIRVPRVSSTQSDGEAIEVNLKIFVNMKPLILHRFS